MRSTLLVHAVAGVLVGAGGASAQGYTYIPIDVSCDASAATCPAGLAAEAVAKQTSARGINARGDIVGFYVDTAGRQHGFLLSRGQYTTIDFPQAGVRATVANGINAQGEIVGQYLLPVSSVNGADDSLTACATDDASCIKGFHLRNGVFTSITYDGHAGAIAQRITDNGDIYGCLHDHNVTDSMFGAAWTRSIGGQDTIVIESQFSLQSNGGEQGGDMAVPMSMNNGGTPGGAETIVGFFSDMSGQQHGYLVQHGILTPYDPTPSANLTAIWDIRPDGQFVGTYRMSGEAPQKRHGFAQPGDGSSPTTLDVTFTDATGNVVRAFGTTVFSENPSGVVVGQYTLSATGTPHGFIGIPQQD